MIRQPGANVANPRPFIKTKTYFGPDRRRNTTSNYIGPKVAGMSRSKDKASVVDHGDARSSCRKLHAAVSKNATAIGLRLIASRLYGPLTQRNASRGPADHGGTMVNE